MFEAAARLPSAITRCMPSARLMRSSKVSVPSAFFLMRVSSPDSASIFMALLIDTSRRSGEAGLMTKSTAPRRMAPMAASIEPLRGEHDDRRARFAFETIENAHAVEAGHDEIEQHEGDGGPVRPFQQLEGLLAGIRRSRLKAEALDGLFENAALGRIVVDDKDTLCHETLELNTTDKSRRSNCDAVCRYWTRRNRLLNSREIARQQ